MTVPVPELIEEALRRTLREALLALTPFDTMKAKRGYEALDALEALQGDRDKLREALEARNGLLREWCQYTNLRSRIRESGDESEYVTGRDLLARTDAAVVSLSLPDDTNDGTT